MKTGGIGGYFELDLPDRGGFLHDDGVLLNSGRNALEFVLMSLRDVQHLYVPYYTCDVVMEPIRKLVIPYSFYHIDNRLELKEKMTLQDGDYLLYTNYFGIKDAYVKQLVEQYGSKLIVDNAQAWFAEPINEINTVYSPRKYVGIPDGGIAYCPNELEINQFEQDLSFDRCSHLLKRIDMGATEGYADFKANSHKLCDQPIRRMSELTKAMLTSIDFDVVKRKRISNFMRLHEALRSSNQFAMPDLSSFSCPMVYPYLSNDASLKQRMIENKIFVATYWPNVKEWAEEGMIERILMEKLLPIPCDQRYESVEINRIISNIMTL